MPQSRPVSDLTEDQAHSELEWLAVALNKANSEYHGEDMPLLDDATFDRWKKRNYETQWAIRMDGACYTCFERQQHAQMAMRNVELSARS